MKDSFGGSIMIYIIIFFLGIYIVFIALTLRYAQSFKVKNKVIDWIEQYNGDFNRLKGDNGVITTYLKQNSIVPDKLNISVVKNGDVKDTCYYVVSTYIDWEWPFLGIEGEWVIRGETKNVSTCKYPDGDITLNFDL
jgi:hypothetical protein